MTKDPVRQTEYQALTDKHVNHLASRLFAEFTGLRFHIAWAPSPAQPWEALLVPGDSGHFGRLAAVNAKTWRRCRMCRRRRLACALRANGRGYLFTCRNGVRNYWHPIRLRGVILGVAYIQALAGASPRRTPWQRSRRQAVPAWGLCAWSGASPLNRADFSRAVRLLRFIVDYIQTSSLADLRQADLARARHALLEFESVQTRMRQELNRVAPVFHQAAVTPATGGHKEQTMHLLLERIHQNYAQPLTLRQFAAGLRLNAAYLSSLFSRVVGMPFKTYLTEIRMEKAKELLSDPARTVAEVAFAAGYTNENRFRSAFKKVTGLPPRLWRETVRLPGLASLLWVLEGTELLDSLGALFCV